MTKLIDTITFWDDGIHDGVENGIFDMIWLIANEPYEETPLDSMPWLTEELKQFLDDQYYMIHSGSKCISPSYKRIVDLYDAGKLGSIPLVYLANSIITKFRDSWNKIYDAITTNYSPLENYDMAQTETPNVTHTKTVKQKLTTENDAFGFNSTEPVHQTKSTASGAKLDNEETNSETGTRGLTRHGNIGVTSSQQLLQSEIDLRSNYQFVEQLFNDVDSILAMLVY